MSLLSLALAVVILAGKATSKYCDGDYFCTPPKECCTLGCCYLYSQPTPNIFNLIIWNHWYLWCVIVVGVCVCCGVCACGVWRRKSRGGGGGVGGGAVRGGGRGGGRGDGGSEEDSIQSGGGSCYQPPPHYSRCSSFHQPPPYNEVTSKPDLYPLVISYSDSGKTSVGGSYLMVHYFRNYIMRPVGSLSATSTADSLSSSLFCNAVNEANSLVPPPYSSAPGSVDQINLHSSPLRQVLSQSESHTVGGMLMEAEMDGRGGGGGGVGGSDQLLSAVSSVAGPLGGASPPQATTPTMQQQQLVYGKTGQLMSQAGSSGGRLKLSLSRGCRHWLSRSAPSTPSTRLAPLPFPSQESSPLLLSATGQEEEEEDEEGEAGARSGSHNNSSVGLEDSVF